MKTPEQIRDMEFQKAPMGGYKQSDVELFLEEVASQIEILMKQKADSDRKLQEFTKKAPEASLSTAGIQNVLISAQRVADQIVEDAKAEADRIQAESSLKLTEAGIKAQEILADAENNAIVLGNTAETEAAKIIAAAVKEAEEVVASAKASVELEQKLYDRLKIEISDFRKKAAEQCAAIIELINQLPDEIPFNIERSKDVLSTDFSNPEELLKNAVDEKLAERKNKEEETEAEEIVEAPVKDEAEVAFGETAIPVQAEVTVGKDAEPQMMEDEEKQMSFEEEEATQPDTAGFVVGESVDKPNGKGHIIFYDDDYDEDDDDDDDDDEPRMFFRKKRK